MDLHAFANDIRACRESPWLAGNRWKTLGALLLERWNDYSPVKWQPTFQIQLAGGGRRWQLPVRMSSEDFAALREIFLYRYYDYDLGTPRTVLDLGGYCGLTAIAFAARFPEARIAVVEPHPGNFAALRSNVERNKLPVTLFNAAATVSDAPVSLFLGGGMTHGLTQTGYSTGESIEVQGISVPSMLRQLSWETVDLLKIDIEGAEEQIFQARQPWLGQVKSIIGEYHRSYQLAQVRRDLEPLGFTVTGLPHPGIFMALRNAGREIT
jgi:FkbM family methyltransferase